MNIYQKGNPGNAGLIISVMGLATFFIASSKAEQAYLAGDIQGGDQWYTIENIGGAALVGGLGWYAYKSPSIKHAFLG